jgi:hypothetical protein
MGGLIIMGVMTWPDAFATVAFIAFCAFCAWLMFGRR